MSIPVGSMYPSMPASQLYLGSQAASPATLTPSGTPQASPDNASNPMASLYSATGGSATNSLAGMVYQILSMLMAVLSQLQGNGTPSQASPSPSPAGNTGTANNDSSSGSSASADSPDPSSTCAGNAGRSSYGGGRHYHGHGYGQGQGPSESPSAGPESPYDSPAPSSSGYPYGSPTPSSPYGSPTPTSGGNPGATPSAYPGSGSTGSLFSGGKEGLGVSDTSANGNGSNLGNTKASWYYNWSPTASASQVNDPNATFIPTIWGAKNMNPQDLQAAANSKSPMIFTFNEPDHPGQANMSPQQALSQWSQLEATGKKLASPAITNSNQPNEGIQWLDQFMQGAKAGSHRVDSISLHWYGDKAKNPEENVASLKNYIEQVHQKYPNLPINLTEFGMNPNGNNAEQDPQFLQGAEKMLNNLPYVQMYSPYGLGNINGN